MQILLDSLVSSSVNEQIKISSLSGLHWIWYVNTCKIGLVIHFMGTQSSLLMHLRACTHCDRLPQFEVFCLAHDDFLHVHICVSLHLANEGICGFREQREREKENCRVCIKSIHVSVIVSLRLTSIYGEGPAITELRNPQHCCSNGWHKPWVTTRGRLAGRERVSCSWNVKDATEVSHTQKHSHRHTVCPFLLSLLPTLHPAVISFWVSSPKLYSDELWLSIKSLLYHGIREEHLLYISIIYMVEIDKSKLQMFQYLLSLQVSV